MRTEDMGQAAEHLAALADDAATTGPILLSRPDGAPVVVAAADEWERASEALSLAETAAWRAEEEQTAAGDDEGPDLSEPAVRARYARYFPSSAA